MLSSRLGMSEMSAFSKKDDKKRFSQNHLDFGLLVLSPVIYTCMQDNNEMKKWAHATTFYEGVGTFEPCQTIGGFDFALWKNHTKGYKN